MLLVEGQYVWTGSELITDGAVLCSGGKVQAVGSRTGLESAHPGVPVVGGAGHIVVPGLINAHHHGNGLTSFMRGVVDDCLEPWLASLASAPRVDPYLDTLWAALGIVQAGYSTVVLFQSTADPARAAEEARARIRACRDVGLRVALGLDLVQQNFYVYGPDPEGLPPRRGLTAEAYLGLLEALRTGYAGDPHVAVFAAPSGPQWVADGTWRKVGAWCREHDVPLHTHCLESPYEAEHAYRAYGGSVVAHLDRLGALHGRTALVHGVYLSREELALMAERGAALVTNPGSNLRLRCGISPVLAALAEGVTVALGTDGCTLGDRDDALAEMRLLFYLQRTPGMDTPALTWQQAFHAATGAAASVTPWAGEAGVIKPGALADLTVFNLEAAAGPWSHPGHHPLHLLLHRGSSRHLAAVVVGGELVWDATQGFTRVDPEDAARRLRSHMEAQPRSEQEGWVEPVRAFYRAWDVSRWQGRPFPG